MPFRVHRRGYRFGGVRLAVECASVSAKSTPRPVLSLQASPLEPAPRWQQEFKGGVAALVLAVISSTRCVCWKTVLQTAQGGSSQNPPNIIDFAPREARNAPHGGSAMVEITLHIGKRSIERSTESGAPRNWQEWVVRKPVAHPIHPWPQRKRGQAENPQKGQLGSAARSQGETSSRKRHR